MIDCPDTRSRKGIVFIIIFLILMSSMTGYLIFEINSSNTIQNYRSSLRNPSNKNYFQIKAPPDIFPAFNGNGTPRYAKEILWGTSTISGLANYPLRIDLPGEGDYWKGTQLNVTINNIYEELDWIINGDFGSGLNNWIKNEDDPNIEISTRGEQAYFKFSSPIAPNPDPNPPQYSSLSEDNTGDFGAITHWSITESLGNGEPSAMQNGIDYEVNSGGDNNRDGAWRVFIKDKEDGGPEDYTATFSCIYTYSYYNFPVASAILKFAYRYDGSSDFDDEDEDQHETVSLDYRATTPSGEDTGWKNVFTVHPPKGSGNLGSISWTDITPVPLHELGLFQSSVGGDNFTVQFKFTIHMDVDDKGWGEDEDYIYCYVDGVELTIKYTQSFGNDIDPDLRQERASFNYRHARNAWLDFDYFIDAEFFNCGEEWADDIYLKITINDKTTAHSYSFLQLKQGAWGQWRHKTLYWDALSSDFSPDPAVLTINFSIVFTEAGWWAKDGPKYFYLDNVELRVQNFASADLVGLMLYDDAEHGKQPLNWNYTSTYHNWLSYTRTTQLWQDGYTSSTFWLNTTSSALITLSEIIVTVTAMPHYPEVTPIFSIETDASGRTENVTWIITHQVEPIYSSEGRIKYWHYNLTIPDIPNWDPNTDWDVVSITDGNNEPVNWQEIPTGGDFKNISIYAYNKGSDAQGTWTIICHSPNRISYFDVVNESNIPTWEFYPSGGTINKYTRIRFTTGEMKSDDANISLYYLYPNGTPVLSQYFNRSILPNTDYRPNGATPYWNIPINADPDDHYVAMVKWVDNGSGYIDEIGFAAHYIQIKRDVIVSNVKFLQAHTLSYSNIVVAGETLRISVNVTDPLLDISLPLDNASLTIQYPDKNDRNIIKEKTLIMDKLDNMYYYDLKTDGVGSDTWLCNLAWMGGVGNRSFTITLYGNSVYLNNSYETYQLTGWFCIVVDTHYEWVDEEETVEQGLSFTLAVKLFDRTPAHNPAQTGISDSDEINNRSGAGLVTDFDGDGYSDTWNGSVFMFWRIIPENLTYWLGNNTNNLNNPNYKWNGTLLLVDGTSNRYETRIRVPYDALPSSNPKVGTYYINITTKILDNEWGWKFEFQYMTITYDTGSDNDPLSTYDDHINCFKLTIEEARGHFTSLDVYPFNDINDPLMHYWKDESSNITRLYVRFYNTSNNLGFNSAFLEYVENNSGSWKVESWVSNAKAPASFGTDSNRLQWKLVNSTTMLPDGKTPDPYQEDPNDNTTWGWFYADFNWTEVNLGEGTFEEGLASTSIHMNLYAKIINPLDSYRGAENVHYIVVKPNPVNITILLHYKNDITLLDENYYQGLMTTDYYWGDILNFTLLARDEILNEVTKGISLRYYIYKQGGSLVTWGPISDRNDGTYSAILNTSDPSNKIGAGTYNLRFRGILGNRSIEPPSSLDPYTFTLKKRNTQLWPLTISGVFDKDSVNSYAKINDIRNAFLPRKFDPRYTLQTVPNAIIRFSVQIIDASPRKYTDSNIVMDANVSWYFRNLGAAINEWRLGGWLNESDENGIYTFELSLSQMYPAFSGEFGNTFELQIVPEKMNYDSWDDNRYEENNPGSTWTQYIIIDKRPIAIIPLKWDYHYSQSNWKYHPIEFVVMDLITGENVSGCQIWWQIGNLQGTKMEEDPDRPGHYYIIYDTAHLQYYLSH